MSSYLTDLLMGPASVALGRQMVPSVPRPDVRRPGPSPFVQEQLYPTGGLNAGSAPSDSPITEGSATQYSDGEAPSYRGGLTVTPFRRGTARPEDVPGSMPFELSANYATNLLKESFGLGGYKYNELTGQVEQDYLRDISYALPPAIAAFASVGQAVNRKNLMGIGTKAAAQEEGYALGMLNGQVIGLSPGIGGGETRVLSGVLPEGLSVEQRKDIVAQLEEMGATSRETFRLEQEERQRRMGMSQANQVEIDSGAGIYQAGDYIDPMRPNTRYTPPAQVTYTSDPEDSGTSGNQYSVPSTADANRSVGQDYSYTAYEPMADGGEVVQKTGFVEGSPDNYTKAQTVADDEYRQVKEGSFVLNAPATEELQKRGMLPTGVDNPTKNTTIKANKGGMMDVALSKGEYVLEPEDAQRIGYDNLREVNNKGKAEVDRRQAASDGGFIDGYAAGDEVTRPTPSPVRLAAILDQQEVVEKPLTLQQAYDRVKDRFPSIEKANKEIDSIIDELPSEDVLAFMILREASVLGRDGMRASGHVAMNRVHSDYKDFSDVTDLASLAKAKTSRGGYQFNVFNISDFREGLAELTQTDYGKQAYADARDLAEEIFYGLDEDNTRGALFFRNPAISTAGDFEKKVRDAEYIPTLTVRGEKSTQEYYRPIELMDAEDTRYIY